MTASGIRPQASQSYDGAGRLTSDATYSYTYDREGNLTSRTKTSSGAVTRYTWNSAHQLLTVTAPAGTQTLFGYDPLGRRVDVTSGTGRVHTVYNGTQPVASYDTTGSLTGSFVYGAGANEQLEETLPGGGGSYYYLHDALGSVTALTTSTGAVANQYRYAAFGQVHATGSAPNPFTYIGAPTDPSTGLVYLNARYLDPATGRFISEDPVPAPAMYPYALNNPTNLTDRTGRATSLAEEGGEEGEEAILIRIVIVRVQGVATQAITGFARDLAEIAESTPEDVTDVLMENANDLEDAVNETAHATIAPTSGAFATWWENLPPDLLGNLVFAGATLVAILRWFAAARGE